MSLKDSLKNTLHQIRNPERSGEDAEFNKQLGFKRLLFLAPFLIVAAILLLLGLK